MTPFETQIVDLMPLLQRYARSLTRSQPDADDLLQDSLVAALRAGSSWRGRNLKAWLMTIMTNLNRNRHRKAAGQATVEYDEETGPPAPGGDAAEQRGLIAAIDALSPDHRAVLMLVVVEGYTYGEVAAMLAIPEGTVMSRLARARKTIADHLRPKSSGHLRVLT